MPHFTADNTDGYSQSDLAALNRTFNAAIASVEPLSDDIRKSYEDYVAERILAEFDATAE